MSKFYEKYLALKKENQEKLYLFRCGNFYIFLDEDAMTINNYVVLKRTHFSKDVEKCGFPVSSLESYLKVFQNHKLPIEIIETVEVLDKEERLNKILKKLQKINPEAITPLDALIELSKLKEIADGK